MVYAAGAVGELHRLWAGHRRGGLVRPALCAAGSRLAFYMPWEVFVGVGLAVGAISILSSLLSMQRVHGRRTGRGVSRIVRWSMLPR